MKSAGRLVVIVALLLPGCTAADPSSDARRPPPAPSTVAAPSLAAGCDSAVRTGPLPMWARAGFSADGSGIPQVLGREGNILAVLFGSPLRSPPAPDRNNKILWVSRLPETLGDPLTITARFGGTSETVGRTVSGGPGPSIIDLPRPGCWHFTLAWSGNTDGMDLTYQPGASA